MFRILESQAPARQTATDTINTLSSRLQSATLLEDRRAAILGLRSFAKEYPASVASGALRALITSLRNDAEDVDTTKVVLETLLMLFAPEESSPEASDELALWLADEFTQLISQISAARPERTQECIFTAPLGISRLVSVLEDAREPIRNEALLLLIALTPSSAELQKVVAFENAFDRIFSLIESDGSLTHGTAVVEDCLSLLGNLLGLNLSNQSYFRETGCIKRLVSLLAGAVEEQKSGEDVPEWTLEQRDKNVWGALAIVQLFLVRGGMSTPTNQTAFWQHGIMQHILRIAFSEDFNVPIKAKALATCAGLISANSELQEKFADLDVVVVVHHPEKETPNGTPEEHQLNVIEALLRLTLLQAPAELLDARLAACECLRAFTENHPGIRSHFLRRAIDGHTSGEDQIPNILTILVNPPEHRGNADPYQIWLASVLLFHLIHDDPETKSLAMKVSEGDESKGEEVITCVQAITGNLLTGMQRTDDKRISVGYLMLLCGWLFEDPDVVNDFLGEGSSIQSLIQETKHCVSSKTLLPGLCAVLLGIIYEFSSKDSPIPRTTLHQLLIGRLGREVYIDKITKLRENPLVRDFEVLPQSSQGHYDGGFPKIFFDKVFIDFLKDNFSRLIRAIDREPGFEVPVIANGIQKGISRELTCDNILQKTHTEELHKLEENHERTKMELIKRHGEELRAMESRLKEISAEYETRATKVRERNDAEIADLKETIRTLETNLEKANKDHIQDLQTAHEEYSSKLSSLEGRCKRAEEREEDDRERANKLEADLKKARDDLKRFKADFDESENARSTAQSELEDLLIVFADLEAKRNEDKKRLKALGQEVSDVEDDEDDGDDDDDDEDDDNDGES
ncbi:general vesicular transport factor p115 [Coccidioides immitis RMSCC 3703]|uniref:General vesicular transport factor p115 n=1 Tax=Coccidioides immitis RMSCC 3703 TaxID=454286 RepID=A0A0J8TEG8_COCIT|nr:general vesicular transport factor p115 [Coccidioides immitis RMSCC 3703]